MSRGQTNTPLSVETVARVGEVLPDGFSVLDLSGVHLAVNEPFCEMVGYSREKLLGSPPDLYWPEEERESIEAAFEATHSGEFDHFQLTFVRSNGERFPVIVSPNVVRDEAGEPAFFFATVKDISVVVRAHSALEESEARYRTLADATPYGIAVHSGGIVRYANAAALRILGAGEEGEVLGQPIAHFIHPDDRELVLARVRALTTGTPRTPWARERFRRMDGSTFHVDVAGSRIRFADEPAVQTAFRDVSEELERERVEAQRNRLEAIGRLAGGVAHDFNNLLTVVLTACTFATEDPDLSAELRGHLESATEAARHGSALTSQLLAFSRQEPLEFTRLALGEELTTIGPILDRMTGEDVSLELDVAEGCWSIRADRTQFERVLLNLVANARNAMPGGGRIRVRATNAPAGTVDEALQVPSTQDFVRMVVADDGQGMDEETQAQVFEPFFTTRRDQGGTGLGLATIYGILVHSGGAVSLRSKPGEGTEVTLLWPRAVRETAEPPRKEPRPSPGAETILVVEDQALVRRAARVSLERQGYTVLEAEGYTDAMALLEQERSIDLLLTDVVLRDRDGPAIVADALAKRPSLPVLFMSGYSARHAHDLGSHPLVEKPFSPATLSEAVRDALDADREAR